MTYDGAAINQHWGNTWPADTSNPEDPDHEWSPVLQAPVANLLGPAWVMECGSPGGDYVTWLNAEPGRPIAEGISRVGFNVMCTDQGVRWYGSSYDASMYENPVEIVIGPPVDTSPEDVAAWIKGWFDRFGYQLPQQPVPTGATT